MAFGLKRIELKQWKQQVKNGEIAIITHFWLDDRFPDSTSVTKVGCSDLKKLKEWGKKYNLKPEWIDHKPEFPHYDLFQPYQLEVLKAEGKIDQIERFNLNKD